MKGLILAGGSGTRLWPLSRTEYPKQFLKLGGEHSLLQRTILHKLDFLPAHDLYVLTSQKYALEVKEQLARIDPRLATNILLEPHSRNTAPALALAIRHLLSLCSEEEVVLVAPADHILGCSKQFAKSVQEAALIASRGQIVTFGIPPTHPETGFGYIKQGEGTRVERFIEKPDLETAKGYLQEGGYFWNSGMFCFSLKTMLKEMQEHIPEILDENRSFATLPPISIDYAVMEKSKKSAILPLSISWSDVGSWDNVYELLPKDEKGNATMGNCLALQSTNCLIIGESRLIATIGVQDLLIIDSPDALLVTKKGKSQHVREIVASLKGRKEVEEHLTTYRPWGHYTVLDQGNRYKIKKITVNPNGRLSLQMHHHRSEHWVVVKGCATAQIGEKVSLVSENESIFVPRGAKHRLLNEGKVPLEIIETQVGEYLGEDDIVRFEDIYGR